MTRKCWPSSSSSSPMDPGHPFHPPQHSNLSFLTAPPGNPSVHYPPPGMYQGTHHHQGGFNTNWGPAQQQQFFYNVHQTAGGGSSTAGTAAQTNNVGHRCQWLTGDTVCNQVFATFDDLMVHLGRVHDMRGSADREMRCQWWTTRGCCGKKCRRDGMRRHTGTHIGCSFSCTECGKPFSRRDSMRAHAKKQH
ncbi:hypothetical protein EV363DRAFT_1131120, partial [Boletus edulis]